MLALRVKVLAVEQIAWHWWPGASAEAAKRRLEQLAQAGWISLRRMAAKGITMLPPKAPLLVIQTGNEEPGVEAGCPRGAQSLEPTHGGFVHSVIGTHRLAAISARLLEAFGYLKGRTIWSSPRSTSHSYALSRLWQRLGVVSNLLLPAGSNGVVPDAMIQSDCATAIEVVGESYGIAKLQRFHDHCMKSRWSYQLW